MVDDDFADQASRHSAKDAIAPLCAAEASYPPRFDPEPDPRGSLETHANESPPPTRDQASGPLISPTSSPGPSRPSYRATSGPARPESPRSCSARRSSSSSPSVMRRRHCSLGTTPRAVQAVDGRTGAHERRGPPRRGRRRLSGHGSGSAPAAASSRAARATRPRRASRRAVVLPGEPRRRLSFVEPLERGSGRRPHERGQVPPLVDDVPGLGAFDRRQQSLGLLLGQCFDSFAQFSLAVIRSKP